ncbi:MAG: penicillin-binding transpeptidase domain-containing protein, partial [Gaiellaceae bacterium]
QTPLIPVPSIGLGSLAVSPLDMASAYATLAAGGVYSKPMAIRKVVLANGKEDTDAGWGKPDRTRVISDGVAYEVTKILEDNVLGCTGVGAYFGRPAAGKTGTTDNHADGWFSGYVPQLETTVWVGYPQGEIPMLDVHGIAVAGGTFPATIWKLFMETAMENAPALSWAYPRDPVVFRPFTQGQYGSSLAPTTTSTATTTQSTTTTRTQTTQPTTTGRTVTTVPPPPPPVEPPPPPSPPPVPPPPPPPP